MRARVTLALACALFAVGCARTRFDIAGSAAAEGRAYILPPKYAGQSWGTGASLVADPILELKIADAHRFALEPYYRLDSVDSRRSHWDVREASYRLSTHNWRFGIGSGIFSWGVLESYRPTDVINQYDFVDQYDYSQKLGQPYVEVGWAGDKASLSVYYLPYFRERTYPGISGRPRFASVVDTDHPEFETSLRNWQPSGAARFALHGRGVDFGLSLFSGPSREPRFILELTSLQVTPRYDLTHRAAFNLQWSYKAFTLKAEGFVALYSNALQVFGGGGVGIDYTFFDFSHGADLTLVAEFLFDTRSDAAPPTFFKHTAFGGVRFAVNDTGNTEVTIGALVDAFDGTTWGRAEATHRFGSHWRVTATANLFFGQSGTLLGQFNRDHFGQLKIAYAF